MTARRRLGEAQMALMLLTRLPAGSLPDPAPSLAEARWAYPFAGVPVGLIGWAAFAALHGVSPALAAVAALAAMALVTGGLHHDGLADFSDGLGGRDRAHSLEIMRDSRIGSFGVIALIFTIALAATAIGSIADTVPIIALFLLIAVASRLAMLTVLMRLPAARGDGLGHSAAMAAGSAGRPGALAVAVLVLCVGAGAIVILAAMAVTAYSAARLAKRRLGGQTGDVLGAVQVLSETAGWIAAAACFQGLAGL